MKEKKFKPSLYTAIIVPVMIIIIITVGWFCALMWISGTFATLERQAISILEKNTSIAGTRLENAMNLQFANMGGLPGDIDTALGEFLDRKGMTLDEFLASHEAMHEFDSVLSDRMLYAMRYLNANGVFVILSNGEEEKIASGETVTLHGLHFRDLNFNETPADYSDIIMEHGAIDQAKSHGLSLDTTWQKDFVISPENVSDFDIYLKPLQAAKDFPSRSPSELIYWGTPRLMSLTGTQGINKNNTSITYSMPLYFDGRLIGVIGSEVTTAFVANRYLKSVDFDILGEGGYALATFENSDIVVVSEKTDATFGDEVTLTLTPWLFESNITDNIITAGMPITVYKDVYEQSHMANDCIYVYQKEDGKNRGIAHLAIHEFSLYPENSPFSDEHWAFMGISPDVSLFANTDMLQKDVIVSGIVCFIFALLITTMVVAFILRPFASLTGQIRVADPVPIIPPKGFDVAEIALLRDTINAGIERAISDSLRIEAEHARLTLALSLATGTLLEYDPETDTSVITRFDSDNNSNVWVIEHVLKSIRVEEGFVHPDDRAAMMLLFSMESDSRVTARINMSKLPKGIYTSEGKYAWIRFACRFVTDGDGKRRLIGTTQDVSAEEAARERDERLNRIDPVTRLFNLEYGMILSREAALRHRINGQLSMLVQIQLEPALACESYYGIFYTNILNYIIAQRIKETLPKDAITIRGGDNEIFIFLAGESETYFRDTLNRIISLTDDIYIGENPDIHLLISAGAVITNIEKESSVGEVDGEGLAAKSTAAVKYVVENNIGAYILYRDLPDSHRKPVRYIPTPIAFNQNISGMSITAIALNLFERTKDLKSVINVIARLAARKYGCERVFVVENNPELLTNLITFYYDEDGSKPDEASTAIRVLSKYYKDFENYAVGDGVHIISSEDMPNENIINLLRLGGLERYSVLACGMYVNGELFGKIVFVNKNPDYHWTENTVTDLNEASKIITSHLSRERSDSASKAKTEFLSKISHEIRTPMNAIIGLSEIALKDSDPKRAFDSLGKIHSSANFLLSIINDVLDMSKIESGKVTINIKPFNLLETVTDAASLVTPLIESRGIDFITEFELKNSSFFADGPRIKQVLINLLGNALKFTEQGFVRFTVKQTDTGVYFAVADSGIGIPKEDYAKIFTSYVQLDSADKVYVGTGLGLPISNNIVSLMGGQIEVSSEVGKGSTFSFTLELEPVEEAPEALNTPEISADHFAGKRALLIEDNDLNTEIAQILLENVGFEVVTAVNGKLGALEYESHESGYFDVILMDIRMPVLDGLGSTKMIRSNTVNADALTVPIIAMTANAFDEDMKKSLEAGMNGYLPKPIETDKLYEMLDKIIFPK
jgi:signal transduction histidine kinase/GGDEF domain-containing protein/ActR/RegA family two-component response regulator